MRPEDFIGIVPNTSDGAKLPSVYQDLIANGYLAVNGPVVYVDESKIAGITPADMTMDPHFSSEMKEQALNVLKAKAADTKNKIPVKDDLWYIQIPVNWSGWKQSADVEGVCIPFTTDPAMLNGGGLYFQRLNSNGDGALNLDKKINGGLISIKIIAGIKGTLYDSNRNPIPQNVSVGIDNVYIQKTPAETASK